MGPRQTRQRLNEDANEDRFSNICEPMKALVRDLPPKGGNAQRSASIILNHVIDEIRSRGDPLMVTGMARFGIETSKALGVSVPAARVVLLALVVQVGVVR